MERQKTIFITSFYGLIGRNILASGLLDNLNKNNIRAIILLPKEKQETYSELFRSDNVVIEGIEQYKKGFRDRIMSFIFGFLWSREQSRMDRQVFMKEKKYIQTFISWIMSKLSRLRPVRQLARGLDYYFVPKNRYKQYFEKYKPSVVFATDIFRRQDVDVLREARKYSVHTIGMVRSWDNVSTKRLNRLIPDTVIVHGPKVRDEIITYGDVSPSTVNVTGIPHYDQYLSGKRTSREKFFKKLNLDPNKKTLLLSPPLRHYSDDPIAEHIVKSLEPFDNIQVIIRMTLVGKSRIGNLKPVPGKLAIDAPENANDFDHADVLSTDEHLTDMLYHCDAIASHISTIAIDAIVFDKPAIYVGFNSKPTPYTKSIRWYFDVDCARDLVSTGGIRLTESTDDFVNTLVRYFDNPSVDKEGRKRVINDYCLSLDGNSTERLSNVILGVLSGK